MNRSSYINLMDKTVLVSNIGASEQKNDLTKPANCKGFGRIRHFRRKQENWLDDPLPIDPACEALKLPITDMLEAQVFQMAYCNMNCWYCFVPDILRAGTDGSWLSVDNLMDLYLEEPVKPKVIDLSGGNPELTPEWVYWWMKTIKERGLEEKIYLWSDDTLSTDSMYKYLSLRQIQELSEYRNYGKVCCFKGFDEDSYFFNSRFKNGNYKEQFNTLKKYVNQGFDVYGYVTITCPNLDNVEKKIKTFFDSLQKIHELLPLRTIPLKIVAYGPTQQRMNQQHQTAINNQFVVKELWMTELDKRFSDSQRSTNIAKIRIR